MATVTYENVSKHFGDIVALDRFSLGVPDGEFVVLVGPSGSGKTTALRVLAGLEALTNGHVYIGRRLVDRVPPRDRDIAMVFQDYGLYPQMTVFQNMAFGLRMRKIPKREIRARVEQAAGLLGMSALLERRPRELSGGQRQRVALGRALVRQPHVFLMDEPLSNLDAKLRTQTRGEIKRLQIQTGTTTVYVTHDQVEAMTMGDRIAVMNDSVLEQVGTPAKLYEHPQNVFVAGFIGSPAMTFCHFSVASQNGRPFLANGDVRFEVDRDVEIPDDVIVGVRPEHARPWQTGHGLVGPFRGRVEFVEALGRETFVGVTAGDGVRFVLQVEGQADATIDDLVEFGIHRGSIHLFDRETTTALGRA